MLLRLGITGGGSRFAVGQDDDEDDEEEAGEHLLLRHHKYKLMGGPLFDTAKAFCKHIIGAYPTIEITTAEDQTRGFKMLLNVQKEALRQEFTILQKALCTMPAANNANGASKKRGSLSKNAIRRKKELVRRRARLEECMSTI